MKELLLLFGIKYETSHHIMYIAMALIFAGGNEERNCSFCVCCKNVLLDVLLIFGSGQVT